VARRTELEPGYVLHTYPYKETSLIVEAFTRSHGRVGLLARGARRPRSALRGMLLSFHPLRLSWSGSAELSTLVRAEWVGGVVSPSGQGLMCGFYLNELLLRLLPRNDSHEALFDLYAKSLARLSAAKTYSSVLRQFERGFLTELGYSLILDREGSSGAPIDPLKRYAYEPERGPVPAMGLHPGALTVSGRTLLDMAADGYERPQTREEAMLLMRDLIGHRLGGQSLHTRWILKELHEL